MAVMMNDGHVLLQRLLGSFVICTPPCYVLCMQPDSLLALVIFVTFTLGILLYAIDFVAFAVEFILFAIEFIALAESFTMMLKPAAHYKVVQHGQNHLRHYRISKLTICKTIWVNRLVHESLQSEMFMLQQQKNNHPIKSCCYLLCNKINSDAKLATNSIVKEFNYRQHIFYCKYDELYCKWDDVNCKSDKFNCKHL